MSMTIEKQEVGKHKAGGAAISLYMDSAGPREISTWINDDGVHIVSLVFSSLEDLKSFGLRLAHARFKEEGA